MEEAEEMAEFRKELYCFVTLPSSSGKRSDLLTYGLTWSRAKGQSRRSQECGDGNEAINLSWVGRVTGTFPGILELNSCIQGGVLGYISGDVTESRDPGKQESWLDIYAVCEFFRHAALFNSTIFL